MMSRLGQRVWSVHLGEVCRDLETGERLRREHLERPAVAFREDGDGWTVLLMMVVSKDIEDSVPETVTSLFAHSEILDGDKEHR